MSTPSAGRVAGAVALTLLVAVASDQAGCGVRRGTPPAARASAAPGTDLEALASLARRDGFSLVLDPAGGDLRIMFRGAELRRFAVAAIQVGRPRFVFLRGGQAGDDWAGRLWEAGRLDPERVVRREVLGPDTPGARTQDAVAIPPTPEEAYPVPPRYRLRFPGGPSLEVRAHDADPAAGRWARAATWWRTYWADLVSAAAGDRSVRLRLVMDPSDAGELYRALPPDLSLVVLGAS